ncbi:MAG: DUF3298 domain-containing protein [Bacteroidetes bacterium]|nr:MAG: DUF3298 domain-containing protein [Bacteroidota bacterium]TAG88880.1 MAG: DUF3298 domain-containing protein [Bacteroidota bacterium]
MKNQYFINILLIYIFLIAPPLFCQNKKNEKDNHFYKQFEGKLNDKNIRIELIKAPSKEDAENNLRGQYFFEQDNKTISFANGSLDKAGHFYIDEGFYKKIPNQPQTFTKTGSFSGTYFANKGKIEGFWNNGKQTLPFVWTENYDNGSAPADIIYNDLNYEDALIRFHYPNFRNIATANKINKFIKDSLLGDMTKKMTVFMHLYQQEKDLGGMIEVFESSNIIYILQNDKHILGLNFATSSETGATHSIYQKKYLNFNLKTGEIITLDDIFQKNYKQQLNQLIEQDLRAKFGIKPKESLAEFGFVLKNNQLPITNNFFITREGIGFHYNVYEIAPYAVGETSLFLTYKQLKSILKNDSLLNSYTKN